MDNYFEQSVAGERGSRERFLYGICGVAGVLLALVALFAATNVVRMGEDGIAVSWPSLVLLVVAGALAALAFLSRDKVYCDYDYILWNSEFEVCAVYNRKSRKKIGTIPLNKVMAWGPASAMAKQMHGMKPHKWCAHEDRAWCVVYPGEAGKEAALVELSEEMVSQMRMTERTLRGVEVQA